MHACFEQRWQSFGSGHGSVARASGLVWEETLSEVPVGRCISGSQLYQELTSQLVDITVRKIAKATHRLKVLIASLDLFDYLQAQALFKGGGV
jgi:hypothetical protein